MPTDRAVTVTNSIRLFWGIVQCSTEYGILSIAIKHMCFRDWLSSYTGERKIKVLSPTE